MRVRICAFLRRVPVAALLAVLASAPVPACDRPADEADILPLRDVALARI